MNRRLILHAPVLFASTHIVLWSTVVVVWVVAWQVQPEPMGPQFRFAQQFIKDIDIAVYSLVATLSVNLAQTAHGTVGAALGFAYALVFACLILIAGTLQWFIIGWLIRWLNAKYQFLSLFAMIALVCWVVISLLTWSSYWGNW
jgi:hypothetical protein